MGKLERERRWKERRRGDGKSEGEEMEREKERGWKERGREKEDLLADWSRLWRSAGGRVGCLLVQEKGTAVTLKVFVYIP